MSRIGKQAIIFPDDVKVIMNGQEISVFGKLGELKIAYSSEVLVKIENNKLLVDAKNDSKKSRSMWGLTRSLINNMIIGVSKGFVINLDIVGVGYRASIKEKILTLFLGYSHDIKFLVPSDIEITTPKPTSISIFGYDKQKVTHIASIIRKLREPEPYKGKGIKYDNEIIVRKEGKKK